MRSSRESRWELRSAEDVHRFWEQHRSVPGRIDGRKHHHEERYCLALYLLALSDHEFLTYPVCVTEGESPDFMLTWASGQSTGLEVTRATENWLQREMTQSEKEYSRRELEAAVCGRAPEPVDIPLSVYGWSRDEAETQWRALFRRALEKKVKLFPGFRPADRYDLLVYDDTPLPAINRPKVLSVMHAHVRRMQEQNPKLGKTSFIVSLDVLYDVGGENQSLRYIEPPDLDDPLSVKSFSDHSEYAGQVSAEQAVRQQMQTGIPIYSGEKMGRVVKQTPDGRRFEVTFREDGEEVIVRELAHK